MAHKSASELDAGLATVIDAPKDEGTVRLIVRRPGVDAREVLDEGHLDPERGLMGDDWERRHEGGTAPKRYAQITVMNARYTELVADSADPARWAEAGDQLYVDMDLSVANLPAGTRLNVGTATIEISAEPHLGCAKFSARFGSDALKLANTSHGRALRLRGANARIVKAGAANRGDAISRA